MQVLKGNTLLDRSFQTSITLKGIDGLLETLGGLLVLFVSPNRMDTFLDTITHHAVTRNPNAFIASHLLHASSTISGHAHYFISFYLVSHGLVKVILVVELWLNRMWAYPGMIIMLVVFIFYQLYRMTFAMSWWLIWLTVFDAIVILLTYAEYKKQRASHSSGEVNER
ncbi:MAG TPA: DUF2127 domain-containing protein [Candidatus Acidoferrales bacterium]|nr:DUF2127 domain-containing protein [Candidatus Acidoferrales bacterium]